MPTFDQVKSWVTEHEKELPAQSKKIFMDFVSQTKNTADNFQDWLKKNQHYGKDAIDGATDFYTQKIEPAITSVIGPGAMDTIKGFFSTTSGSVGAIGGALAGFAGGMSIAKLIFGDGLLGSILGFVFGLVGAAVGLAAGSGIGQAIGKMFSGPSAAPSPGDDKAPEKDAPAAVRKPLTAEQLNTKKAQLMADKTKEPFEVIPLDGDNIALIYADRDGKPPFSLTFTGTVKDKKITLTHVLKQSTDGTLQNISLDMPLDVTDENGKLSLSKLSGAVLSTTGKKVQQELKQGETLANLQSPGYTPPGNPDLKITGPSLV